MYFLNLAVLSLLCGGSTTSAYNSILPLQKNNNNKNSLLLCNNRRCRRQRRSSTALLLSDKDATMTTTASDELNLPLELRKITNAFSMVDDDSLRHKQLLYMANQIPAITAEQMTSKNKVPGCLSTVYVDGTARWCEEKEDYVVDYVGDSDGLLTKGLVALLIRGLSGSTAKEIELVDPEFIREAQIGQSLTPGRNNGFLNMLVAMKRKAVEITKQQKKEKNNTTTTKDDDDDDVVNNDDDDAVVAVGPMHTAITETLQLLQPSELVLTSKDDDRNFNLSIVASAFEDLGLVKREKLIFMVLGEIMPNIETLTIVDAKTPEEKEE